MSKREEKGEKCNLCPRNCNVDRSVETGFCGVSDTVKAAAAMLHFGEEPPISGKNGSGAVFFSGCNMRCVFCQNYEISRQGAGKEVTEEKLRDIFLRLQEQGAHNINLVTATHYLPSVVKALESARPRLSIPIVYNCGGYERPEIIQALEPYVDIWLPDLKYYDSRLSSSYSDRKSVV